MKKSISLLFMVALLATMALLSAPVFGQQEADSSSVNLVGVIVDPPTIQPGEKVAVSILGDVKEVTCDGKNVPLAFFLAPTGTHTYKLRILGKQPGKTAIVSFTVQVGERLRFYGEIGPFISGKKKLDQLTKGAKTANELKKSWQSFKGNHPGAEYNVIYRASTDKPGSTELNTEITNARGQNARDYIGERGEIIKLVQVDERKVRFEAVETDASFYRRLGHSELKGGFLMRVPADTFKVKMSAPSPAVADTVLIKEKVTDRVRLTVGVGYAQESPMVSLGLRIPLAQESVQVKSDVHVAGHFGHDGHDFGWTLSAQVDFQLGRGFYVAPIIMGGQNFPDFGEVTNYSQAAGGGTLQARVKNKLVFQLGAVCEYRAYYRVDGKKTRPDEIGPKLFFNVYYAF